MSNSRIEDKIQAYKNEIKRAVDDVLTEYMKRLNKKHKHNDISPEKAATIIGTAVAIGTAAGTPLPILGNVIGAAAGVLVGGIIVSAIKIKYAVRNQKVNNAKLIKNYLGDDEATKNMIINEVIDKIVNERTNLIRKLSNTDTNKKSVANYLATSMMKAIKNNAHSKNNPETKTKIELIASSIKDAKSKKLVSQALEMKENAKEVVTLKSLTRLTR